MKFSEVKIISFLTLKVIQTPFGLREFRYHYLFANVYSKLQERQLNACFKDDIWFHLSWHHPFISCWRRLLKVICGAKHRVPLSKRNCLSPSMTQIISLHIKLQETVPAGSINVFITLPHNFPPGRKLGKQAPSLASTFKNGNRKVIMAVIISNFLFKLWI